MSAKMGRLAAGVWVAVFLIFAYNAYPTAKEKKPGDKIQFLKTDPEVQYLVDTGSYVSNNIVHLEFKPNLLPQSAMLYLDYCAKTDAVSNLRWTTFLSAPLSDWPEKMEFTFENASSNRWVFYTTYTPGPVVHTNGVAVAEFIKAPEKEDVAVPKRAVIYQDGKLIWPNKELLIKTMEEKE
jgi:hypothetical protein